MRWNSKGEYNRIAGKSCGKSQRRTDKIRLSKRLYKHTKMNLKKIKSLRIGSNIEIKESKNKTLVGVKGKGIYQTKSTITLETSKGIKKIILSHIKIK